MVRHTTRPAELGGHALPAGCEVLLSPFVTHRDEERFPEPDAFRPRRWLGLKPTGFEYLPFGAGARYCVGRVLATDTLRLAVAVFLSRFDLVLAHDQAIDWEMNVNLTPTTEPVVELRAPGPDEISEGARAGGPFGQLLNIDLARGRGDP
jgi:unspecific monooxygenase